MEKIPTIQNKIIVHKYKEKRAQELLETLNSITKDDINELVTEIEIKEPVHDLEWARNALCDTSETLEHYKNYEEALKIISQSKEPIYFMRF